MATIPATLNVTVQFVVDAKTRDALIALGWTPPPRSAPMTPWSDASAPIHACPPEGEGVTPCCGRNPHELLAHRITLDPAEVTCKGRRKQ